MVEMYAYGLLNLYNVLYKTIIALQCHVLFEACLCWLNAFCHSAAADWQRSHAEH